ncbi:aldehyde dehydrogenase family protein [Paenibacillus mendelii]|uniref:Aldehyde dehydrogenase family protein n=1 Tax=Paenibacillus mendelii TaxID=206163 RepID=A0ABV6J744_9BACL|nr:aldehyde dehydrogenase family protein [Paenibacillus mendelii]MCQ6561024.1 aldehyde dehydrogenase family protein [Paenibacillus mendelii]
MTTKQMFIGGQWVEGKQHYELRSPYSGERIAMVPLADQEDVEAALSSAAQAARTIRGLTSLERSTILEKVSQLFQERLEECALLLADEAAKPLKAARAEIARTIETYKFAAEEAKRIHGETIPLDAAKSGAGRFGYTKREPLGVIAAITPFNFPFNLTAHKLGPAFAAGNTVVLKPASQTPLSGIMTAKLFEEAGLPAGALNVVTGSGGVIGDLLVKDARVKMITFTGSAEVGLGIKEKAGLKRVTLELGSNSAVIIDSAEDLEAVAARCVEGAFNFAGQVCISVQRVYVQQQLFSHFLSLMKEKAGRLVFGDPRSEHTDISSLIHQREAERIERWVMEAEQAGASIACGGKREGGYFQPTIIAGGASHLLVSCSEAFGPIVTVNAYDSWDEAVDLVNDSDYGLQAGVYTTSIKKAFDAAERLEVGGVIINDIPSFRVDQMPYGGVKTSGIGKEGIKYSTEEMSEIKFVSFKL